MFGFVVSRTVTNRKIRSASLPADIDGIVIELIGAGGSYIDDPLTHRGSGRCHNTSGINRIRPISSRIEVFVKRLVIDLLLSMRDGGWERDRQRYQREARQCFFETGIFVVI